MLFACAWTAAVTAEHRVPLANQVPLEEPPAMAEHDAELSPAAVGAALLGTGAIAGAAATWALTRPRQRPAGR
jgi:hypothetical protein